MNNKALIKWLDDAHKQEVFIQEMGFDGDFAHCERNKMHIEALKRLVEANIEESKNE